ncbi:MAG: L-serine ammonia-lyase [Pirellula sp.]|nr:L-serine ammonia-lyase [Pirellula sp.]
MISVFELFKVGVGPSSSHTVGPMIAAYRFAHEVTEQSEIARCCARIRVELYGSLALTGLGHATDTAIFCGLAGCLPDRTEVDKLQRTVESLRTNQCIELAGKKSIPFDEKRDLIWLRNETLPAHPNAIQFSVLDTHNQVLFSKRYYSTGGGFVYDEKELASLKESLSKPPNDTPQAEPFPFTTAAELIQMARESNCRIDQIVDGNEQVHRSPDAIAEQLDRLWAVMAACIDRGCMSPGILPGSLHIRRRAPGIYQKLTGGTSLLPSQWLEQHAQEKLKDPLQQLDWVSLFALAVNEENAAGGQVVTAPTNGAAGVIPAVLGYYVYLVPDPGHPDFDRTISDREGVHRFLKTAGAIGMLYKRNASLSAAEMGCQGEVGVACSMAAAGLAACMGGTIEQIENAAEIGMEHNLGLTCDPIAGLVQVPCIERNTMGATKAINAARLAVLYGDGKHFVSLDRVIETMRQTGVDMQSKYKETSLGGLAVNVVDC